MNILDKREMGKEYGDLEIGECFELGENFYIKTNIIEDDTFNDLYAVNLSTGIKYEIGSKVIVFPVVAELLIN